jgi:PAS domain S-box-containing protein
MSFLWTPYSLLPAFAAVISGGLAWYSFRQRAAPGGLAFAATLAFFVEWSLGYFFELNSATQAGAVLWDNVQFIGSSGSAAAVLVFALQYTDHSRGRDRRLWSLLALEPVLTTLAAFTNPWHGLIRTTLTFTQSGAFPVLSYGYGPWLLLAAAYEYCLLLLTAGLLVRYLVRASPAHRPQIALTLAGISVPWVGTILTVLGLVPLPAAHLDITPLTFSLGSVLWALGVFRYGLFDIVPVARAALMEGIPDGVLVLDLQNRVVDLNRRAERLITQTAAQAVGRPVEQVLAAWPEVVERFLNVREGEGELSLPLGDQPRHYHVRVAPLYGRPGEMIGRLIVVQNITARKQLEAILRAPNEALEARVRQRTAELQAEIAGRQAAQAALQQRVAELSAINTISQILVAQPEPQALLEHAGEQIRAAFNCPVLYIALHDPDTNLVNIHYEYGDGRRLPASSLPYGSGLTAWVMQTRQPLLINTDWAQTAAGYGAIYTDGLPARASLHVPLLVADRAIGALSLQDMERENAFTLDDQRLLSTIAATLAVAIDNARLGAELRLKLAERETLIRELAARNADLERFTYTVSHDLKSPLISIRGFLGYLEQDMAAGNQERLQDDLTRITQATDKMYRLLNELLEFSRVGRQRNPPETLPMGEIVNEARLLTDGRLAARGVEVVVAPHLPSVRGDRVRLVEVVQNLLDNAAKFMGSQPAPRVEIGVRPGTEPVFYVRDNGQGIEAAYLEMVFGLFDKLDAQSDGTGIGLALVRRIVETHGGRIWAESDGPGQGTTFCFTLPGEDQSLSTTPAEA